MISPSPRSRPTAQPSVALSMKTPLRSGFAARTARAVSIAAGVTPGGSPSTSRGVPVGIAAAVGGAGVGVSSGAGMISIVQAASTSRPARLTNRAGSAPHVRPRPPVPLIATSWPPSAPGARQTAVEPPQ